MIQKLDEELGLLNDGVNRVPMKPVKKEPVDIAPQQEKVPKEQRTQIDPEAW